MNSSIQLDFAWITTEQLTPEILLECSQLFSAHYGLWGSHGPRPGEPIGLSPRKLREYVDGTSGRAALARHKGKLVCYAFAVIYELEGSGKIAWVTQLVTHREYRNKSVATRLLRSIWSFSDYFAWGLVTANPFAVRALEGATSRKCDPISIEPHAEALVTSGAKLIPYVAGKEVTVDVTSSVIATDFYVSHLELPDLIKAAQTHRKWYLGSLEEGQEWLAFTFRSQETRMRYPKQLEEQLKDSEAILKRAYEGMSLNEEHAWTNKTPYEIEFAVGELGLRSGMRVLDLGCGNGRHALALAEQNFNCVGVDFIHRRVAHAHQTATEKNLSSRVSFLVSDARKFRTTDKFDAALCLYDVVGSFPDDADNSKIISALYDALLPGAKALLSVMNLSLTRSIATQRFVLDDDPSPLYSLVPNTAMQNTGEIFDPNRFLIDTKSEIVYRKEQFDLPGANLPTEVIVRDRRYDAESIKRICESAGFKVLYVRHVHAGDWTTDLHPEDRKAKEILVLLEKQLHTR